MNLSLFEFDDYKKYLQEYIRQSPKNGWGVLSRWADVTRISQAQLSQVIGGDRDLTAEQTFAISQVLKHTHIETKYLQLLVQKARAGTKSFENFVKGQIQELQKSKLKIGDRIDKSVELSEEHRSIYFSHWIYACIRQFCFINGGQSPDQIKNKFNLDPNFTDSILKFLLKAGICKEIPGGKIYPTSAVLKIGKSSPALHTHHTHWRLKALENFHQMSEKELMLTVPMALSRDQFNLFRERLVKVTMDLVGEIQTVSPEEVGCLNIDFFTLTDKRT